MSRRSFDSHLDDPWKENAPEFLRALSNQTQKPSEGASLLLRATGIIPETLRSVNLGEMWPDILDRFKKHAEDQHTLQSSETTDYDAVSRNPHDELQGSPFKLPTDERQKLLDWGEVTKPEMPPGQDGGYSGSGDRNDQLTDLTGEPYKTPGQPPINEIGEQ